MKVFKWKKRKYQYLISYHYKYGFETGFVTATVCRFTALDTFEKITELIDKIKSEYNYDGIAIVNIYLVSKRGGGKHGRKQS